MTGHENSRREGERLQKMLARLGVGSRRASEELMRQGRVEVNGRVVTELGTRVIPGDVVAVDGVALGEQPTRAYYVLHKPPGYVSTLSDPQGRPAVVDLFPSGTRLVPVGRLDADSEGLLLLTNDGELVFRLTHPRYGIGKEYEVLVSGRPDERALRLMREGVEVEGRLTAPAQVAAIRSGDGGTWLRFVIHEGRKRQIRRMCEAVGVRVLRLVRTAFGPIRLGRLPQGKLRPVTRAELARLREAAGYDQTGLVIAIDGPAGAGKSTLGEELAKRHQMLYLDTGAMYRAVALLALRNNVDPRDEAAATHLAQSNTISLDRGAGEWPFSVRLDGEDVTRLLYTPEVDRVVSVVSAVRGVREALVRRQREIARSAPSVVVGRDIGTVVVPDAPIKVYVDASPEQRAARRLAQLRTRGIELPLDQVLAQIRQRDDLDSGRALSPLVAAPDALVLTTDNMTVEEEVAVVEDLMRLLRVERF